MKTLQHLSLLLCCVLIPIISQANNKGPTIKEALEISANQQVLSQRISKIYLALCHNNRDPKLYQERAKAVEAFEEQLYRMSLLVPNERVKKNIQEVRYLWKSYKSIADWTIKNEAIDKLLNQASNLLKATKLLHAAYQEYEYTVKENGDLITINQYINHIHHQRVIIERVMAYYLANKQSVDDLVYSYKLEESKKAFTRILFILEKAGTTSQTIQSELKIIRKEWELMTDELKVENKDLSKMHQMLERSKMISQAIQEMVYSYEALGEKISLSYAVNQATQQCVLVQKIAKSYVACIHERMPHTHKKEVLEYIKEFEQTQEAMFVTAPTEATQEAIRVTKVLWKNYKELVSDFDSFDPIKVIKVLEQCHVVLAACDQVTKAVTSHALTIPAYQKLSIQNGKPLHKSMDITHQVQLTSQLRVYTQRMTLYFIMKVLNIDQELSTQRLENCIAASKTKFEELKKCEITSLYIDNIIENCMQEWKNMETICNNQNTNDIDPLLLHCNKLSNRLKALNGSYEHYMNELFAQDMEYTN